MFFKWSDDLNTGIEEIDRQHRRIVDYINVLSTAGGGGNRTQVETVLEELLDYTVNHFLFEERLMEEGGYDHLGAHQKVHELFGKRVAGYRQRFAQGEDVTQELLEMLKNWLQRHIKEEDQNYVPWLKPVVERQDNQQWMSGMLKKFFG